MKEVDMRNDEKNNEVRWKVFVEKLWKIVIMNEVGMNP